jgi:hypothetical protein
VVCSFKGLIEGREGGIGPVGLVARGCRRGVGRLLSWIEGERGGGRVLGGRRVVGEYINR